MKNLFEIIFLDEVIKFLDNLDDKHREKILYNIGKAQAERNVELFKKLNDEIWEFRTLYEGIHYRLLAFWDKTDSEYTLVISTHGIIKKKNKMPEKEIKKAIKIRENYFEEKEISRKKKS